MMQVLRRLHAAALAAVRRDVRVLIVGYYGSGRQPMRRFGGAGVSAAVCPVMRRE